METCSRKANMVSTDGVHVFTSFSYSYLSRARVLAQTVKAAHPEWTLWALIVDKPPAEFDHTAGVAEFDYILLSHELPIFRFESWIFKHDVVEACTAVKGEMLCKLLE